MVSIGRGLMSAPQLLLVDEPSLGLSPRLVQETFAVLQRIHEAGVTIFLVEQNVHQTLGIATRGYVLAKGRVVTDGYRRRSCGPTRGCTLPTSEPVERR